MCLWLLRALDDYYLLADQSDHPEDEMAVKVYKTELLALARAIVARLESASYLKPLRLITPTSKSIVPTTTDGWCLSLGHFLPKMDFEIWLDRWLGMEERFYWFGFYSKSSSQIQRWFKLAQATNYGRKPVMLSDRSWTWEREYSHLIHPLAKFDFDRLVCENYRSGKERFFGIYSPLEFPLGKEGVRALSKEAVNFLMAFSRAESVQASELGRDGKRTTKHVFPKPSKEVELAAVRVVRQWLTKQKYSVKSRESEACGYDLLGRKAGAKSLHVEVKGASGTLPRFFLTTNEFEAATEDPSWRLALVTRALRNPRLALYSVSDVKRLFEMWPMAWQFLPKMKSVVRR